MFLLMICNEHIYNNNHEAFQFLKALMLCFAAPVLRVSLLNSSTTTNVYTSLRMENHVFVLSLCFVFLMQFGNVISQGFTNVTYGVVGVKHRAHFIQLTSLPQCVTSCALRPWCNVLGYVRRLVIFTVYNGIQITWYIQKNISITLEYLITRYIQLPLFNF